MYIQVSQGHSPAGFLRRTSSLFLSLVNWVTLFNIQDFHKVAVRLYMSIKLFHQTKIHWPLYKSGFTDVLITLKSFNISNIWWKIIKKSASSVLDSSRLFRYFSSRRFSRPKIICCYILLTTFCVLRIKNIEFTPWLNIEPVQARESDSVALNSTSHLCKLTLKRHFRV